MQRAGERPGERDPVALDGDVDVEALLAEQDVAYGAADEVDALEGLADGLDRLEDAARAPGARAAASASQPPARRRPRRGLAERAQEVAAGHDADHLAAVAAPATRPARRGDEQPLQLGERRVLGAGDDRPSP